MLKVIKRQLNDACLSINIAHLSLSNVDASLSILQAIDAPETTGYCFVFHLVNFTVDFWLAFLFEKIFILNNLSFKLDL